MASVKFSDSASMPLGVRSMWQAGTSKKSVECQTSPELYQFDEAVTQTGICNDVIECEITKKEENMTLIDFLCSNYSEDHGISKQQWLDRTSHGFVSVGPDVITNPNHILERGQVLEYINYINHISTQTLPEEFPSVRGSHSIEEELHDLSSFLRRVCPMVEKAVERNAISKVFDGYTLQNQDTSSAEIALWNTLSVDLEKHKIIYPDWSTGAYYPGTILRCVTTRNKARTYDVELTDGTRLTAVREEYIHGIIRNKDDDMLRLQYQKRQLQNIARFQEGMKVHAKFSSRSGVAFLPSRITKVHKNGSIDVDMEGTNVYDLSTEDIMLGFPEGQYVETRRPQKTPIYGTATSWNASGGLLAVAYGRNDVSGWCDVPGAVCIWSIFSKDFSPSSPAYILDHSNSLTTAKFHPVNPAIIAAGSFNGEVLVWDITTPEQAIAVSTMNEYAHNDAVLEVAWVWHASQQVYQLVSLGADGRVLVWNVAKGMLRPESGVTLATGKKASKRHYPLSHGGTSISFSGGELSRRPQWVVVGMEGGGIMRGQGNRVLNSAVNEDRGRGSRDEETYQPLRRTTDAFMHEMHVGPVNSIDCSPFHRSLFVTGGQDGVVRVYHMLDRTPLLEWSPSPAAGTAGVDAFSPITAVRFSPIRPCVFAASSADGFVYIYDLLQGSTPVVVLEAPAEGSSKKKRVGVTALAFNRKQRDLLSACDLAGKIHVWRLGWKIANVQSGEQEYLDSLGNVLVASDEADM